MLNIKKQHIYYLLGFGLFVRLIVFFVFYTHITIYPDSSGYIELAERLTGFDLSGYSGQRSPGYPLLIALAWCNLYVVVFIQFMLGVIASLYWYKTLLKLHFSEKHCLWISLFLSTLLNVVFFETSILTESFTLFLLTVIIYRLINLNTGQLCYKNELITGLLLGALTLIKPFYAFLPFLLYALYVLKHFDFKRLINKRLILLIFPLIAYFGWSYINKTNTGYFVSTTFLGLNMAQNCVRFAENSPEEYVWLSEPYVKYREKSLKENKNIAMSIWYAYNDGAYNKYNIGFNKFSHELGKFAKATIKQNPLAYFKQVVFHSWKDFWKPVIYWDYNKFNFKYGNNLFLMIWYVQKTTLYLFRLSFLLMIPLIIIKCLKKRKISNSMLLALIVLTASILQALVTYGTNSRFSFPFEFIMIFVVLYFLKENNVMAILKKKLKLDK